MDFTEAIELAVKGFDTARVGTMVVGALLAAMAAARAVRADRQGTYSRFRRQLGRSISWVSNYSSQPTSSGPSPSPRRSTASSCSA